MGALLLLEYGLAASVVAVGWGGYVVSLLADFGLVIPPQFTGPSGYPLLRDGVPVLVDGQPVTTIFNLPAFLICLSLAALLVVGVSESAKVNNLIVFIKVSVLAAFIVVGGLIVLGNLPALVATNWTPFIPENTGEGEFGVDGIMRAASIVFFAYIGFEAVSTAGQEAKDPKRDMPFGIIGSLVVCTVIYMLVAAIMTLLVPYQTLNVPDPVAVVVDSFGAQWAWLAKIIKVGAIIGLTSVVLVLMYAQTRIFYTMARDGLLPKVFAKVHPTFKTPYINTILVGVITAVMAGFFDINILGDATSVGTLAAFAIVCLSVIYLRRSNPDLPRGFKVPFYPVLPILGILSCLYLITTVPANVLVGFMYYMVGATVLYFVYGMRNSELGKGHAVTADGEMPYYPEDNSDGGTVTRD
jgi:APA family basic amino acid/polyamine antiporter